ncbi:MAG: hypothetical protein QGF46_02400 [Planctomycetota bacterium]|jgi:hypothetical protein|nr:hypothetical protein [Planctomycetota bacterium]
MISLLLFASLFFSSAQQLQVFETEVNQHQLSTELIYSHPALLSGDMDTFAADLLTAIENDYKSDLLAEACYMLKFSNQLANRVVSSSRVARLIELSNGSTASDYLVGAFYHNLERSRFQLPERLPFREDLRSNWISNWHVANN